MARLKADPIADPAAMDACAANLRQIEQELNSAMQRLQPIVERWKSIVEDYERELTSVNASIATLEKNMLELGYDLPVKLPGLSPFWWPWS